MCKSLDIHTHLSQLKDKISSYYADFPDTIHVSTALNKQEVDFHLDNNIPYWFAGCHPMDINNYTLFEPILIKLLESKKILGIGEIGLDKRFPNNQLQIEVFLKQLKLAEKYQMPILLHAYGSPYKIVDFLKRLVRIKKGVIMHGFKGSMEVFKELDKLEVYISLSNRILKPLKHREVVKAILATGRYFIESDYPYNGDLKETTLIAQKIEEDYRISGVMDRCIENFELIFGRHCGTISEI